jgi:putative membrane protein
MLLDKRLPLSYLFKKVKFEVITVLFISLAVYYLTSYFRNFIPLMPIGIPTFLGTAISVILSFKLSQSYDRWWEARKVWGSIVNDSRSLVLQVQSFLTKSNQTSINLIAHRQIAWCHSLGLSLKDEDAMTGLDVLLSAEECKMISTFGNKPLAILQLNAKTLADLRTADQLNTFEHMQINNTMVRLTDAMGMAERIKNTVFPVTYRICLHAVIYLFIVTLSISLRDISSIFEVPLLLVISIAFFFLEKAATDLQDPFNNKATDVPVKSIANTIEINIRQLLAEDQVPKKATSYTFYIL